MKKKIWIRNGHGRWFALYIVVYHTFIRRCRPYLYIRIYSIEDARPVFAGASSLLTACCTLWRRVKEINACHPHRFISGSVIDRVDVILLFYIITYCVTAIENRLFASGLFGLFAFTIILYQRRLICIAICVTYKVLNFK